MKVEKVDLRPGKPTWFGMVDPNPVLGLPGNPASALVCAHLFLRPLIEAMLGRDPEACVRSARRASADSLPANGSREHYLRASLDRTNAEATVRAFEQQDSSLLSVFASANALIRLAPHAPALDEGALVDVLTLDRSAMLSPPNSRSWRPVSTCFARPDRGIAIRHRRGFSLSRP